MTKKRGRGHKESADVFPLLRQGPSKCGVKERQKGELEKIVPDSREKEKGTRRRRRQRNLT